MIKTYKIRKYAGITRENLSTLTALIVLVILSFIVFNSIKRYIDLNDQYSVLNKEVSDLDQSAKTINASKVVSSADIDSLNGVLLKLIPESEDGFSVIYAIENISKNTGFIIDSYNININGSKNGKMVLSVEGYGDIESFNNFLMNYNFEGGRLVTTDKIALPDSSGKVKLNLTFYSAKSLVNDTASDRSISTKDLREVRLIKDKIVFTFSPTNNSTDYTAKEDPFK